MRLKRGQNMKELPNVMRIHVQTLELPVTLGNVLKQMF